MSQTTGGEVPLKSEHDIVLARQLVRRLTQQLGFSIVDQTKMVTASSELARNALIHGGGGAMQWHLFTRDAKQGLELVFIDAGPGIANLELAMTDGWSSGQGLGMGLSGARRLVNDFNIRSAAGAGTTVTIRRWK